MSTAQPAPAGVTPSSPPPPWWATPIFHFVTGLAVLAAGLVVLVARPEDGAEAFALIGSGVTFLGVGAGAAPGASP